MNDFLDEIWYDNPVRNYLKVVAAILLVLLFKRYIARYVADLLFLIVHSIWRGVDKASFRHLIAKPLGFFLFVLVTIIALHSLTFPEELNVEIYRFTVKELIHSLGTIVLIICFINLVLRIIDFVALILEKKANLTPDQADNQLIIFFKDFFKVLLVIIGIVMMLKYAFGFSVGNFLTGLSIVGAAIALSLRESLENLIASFIIFFDKPFTTGDLVKVHHVTGTVERIGLRSTRIRTDQKTYVSVPNKQMVDSIVDNLSLRSQRRGDLRLEVDPQTPSGKLEELIIGIRKVVDRKEIETANVYLTEISSNAAVIVSDYYTAPITIREFNAVRQDVNLQSLKLLEDLNVEIAGSSKDLRLSKEAIDAIYQMRS
jgi:MscS family membrane protein